MTLSPRTETAIVLAALTAIVAVPIVVGLRIERTPRPHFDLEFEARETARFNGARRRR